MNTRNTNTEKPCPKCGGERFVEGTLEGVSFQSIAEGKKLFSSGVYGIGTIACTTCGYLLGLYLNVEGLREMLKKQ